MAGQNAYPWLFRGIDGPGYNKEKRRRCPCSADVERSLSKYSDGQMLC